MSLRRPSPPSAGAGGRRGRKPITAQPSREARRELPLLVGVGENLGDAGSGAARLVALNLHGERLSFDQVFRETGHRRVGGGPKATGADEFTFVGDLGRGTIVLTSRVRLIDPLESYYTTASHRLRDSKVGDAGHWIDLRVLGPCNDAELALVERLAQAVDTRPVRARRSGQG